MNITTDVQSTTEETKEKRYKTLFGSVLGDAADGNLMGALSLIFIIYPIGLVTMLLCVPETKGKVLE